MFTLHPQLQKDCLVLGTLDLCCVLLMRDAQFPWLILVPQREAVSEVYQLTETDQQLLQAESSWLAKRLAEGFSADKMNIAALGNVVNQLHIHHVVRYCDDPLWPKPIWGQLAPQAYSDEALKQVLAKLEGLLAERLHPFFEVL